MKKSLLNIKGASEYNVVAMLKISVITPNDTINPIFLFSQDTEITDIVDDGNYIRHI